jgi:hypothetical protein
MRNLQRRSICLALLVALTITFTGCGGSAVTQTNYDKIKTGMSKSDVEGILGTGKEQVSSGGTFGGVTMNAQGMVWQDGNKIITVMFMNDEVQSKSQMGLN